MKHRSPLITLAAVAVAFAIMFIVNMLASPPENGSVEPAGPQPASSSAPLQLEKAEIDPGSPQVTVDSGNLNAAPINGDEGL